MLKTLLKVRLRGMLDSMTSRRFGKRSKAMQVLMAVLFVYCGVVFLGMFGGMFYLMREPFTMIGMGWLYYGIAGVLSSALCFVGSVFFTQSVLFEARDNELLLSLPIRSSVILACRMALILLLNYGFSLLVTLPCGVVRCFTGSVTAAGVVRYIIAMALLPLLPTTLSCIVGWLIALITSRMRNKNLITILLSFAFMGAYLMLCMNAQSYITRLVENGEAIGSAIRKALPPFYALGIALEEGSWSQLLLFALWCVLPFAVVYAALSRSFISIATMKRGGKKVRYESRALHASSVRFALMKKELSHLVSSANYMMNGCVGALMTLILSVMALVKRDVLLSTLDMMNLAGGLDMTVYLAPCACVMICTLMSMNLISAPSVSIEGKNLWLMQSIPVRAGDILLAKAYAHMAVCLPAGLISSILVAIALKAGALDTALLMLLPALTSTFSALLGVTVNLRFPRFDYVNETVAIKQSMSTLITMFGGMGVVALPVILYAAVFKASFPPVWIQAAYALLLAIASVVMYDYLANRAENAFAKLNQE